MIHTILAHDVDRAELLHIYISTRAEEVAAWGWDEATGHAFLTMQYQMQSRAYQMQFPDADHRLIEVDGARVGRVLVFRDAEHLRLVDIALLPAYRNRGIGTTLIRELQAEAASAGKPLRLSVLKTNRAMQLYARLGFVQTGVTETHIAMEWRPPTSGQILHP